MARAFENPVRAVALAVLVAIMLLALLPEPRGPGHAQTPGEPAGASTATSPVPPADAAALAATTPFPANTGAGDGGVQSGATNPVAILLGAIALAGIVGAGGRFAVRRRST